MRKLCLFILAFLLSGCTLQPVFNVGDKIIQWQKFEQKVEKVMKKEAPAVVNWPVAFAPQAPTANWDLPYQEACEEAALIQARKYFYGEPLDGAIMDAEIKKVVDWEKERLGLYSDTELTEVEEIASEYFNLDVEISEDVSVENIKKQLDGGYLVLAPTAGRELGNPYYKQPGPLYHFLVIRGYNATEFITNDVGTKRGEGFSYKYNVVINAIHDLPRNDDGTVFRPYDESAEDGVKQEKMLLGKKKILIVRGKK